MVPEEHAESEPVNDRMVFCRDLCAAAKSAGMRSRIKASGKLFHVEWLDMSLAVKIKGPPSETKEDALFLACESLVKYFNGANGRN